jgi:hypothetical protein
MERRKGRYGDQKKRDNHSVEKKPQQRYRTFIYL